MKKMFLFLMVIMLGVNAFAQGTELTGDSRTEIVSKIEKAHKQLTSLSATFTQEKKSSLFTDKVVQKGKLQYKSPKQLRWEYTSPTVTTVIFNNGKVSLKNANGKVSAPNKMLNEMGSMIINTINGNFLKDNADFKARYYKNGKGEVTVILAPINKKIKSFYKNITIVLNASTLLADKVIMNEANGDVTTIDFASKKTNVALSDSLFK